MSRGGYREGAGRKKGSNIYGEPTTPVRVPVSYVNNIKKQLEAHILTKKNKDIFYPQMQEQVYSPLYSNTVSAGFPSPADEHIEQMLDLNEHLIPHQETTFFLRVKGDSMIDAQISEGDLLIVDKSIKPKDKDIIIAVVYGEVTVKRLVLKKGYAYLKPENKNYPLIPVSKEEDFVVWGVVTHVIHKAA